MQNKNEIKVKAVRGVQDKLDDSVYSSYISKSEKNQHLVARSLVEQEIIDDQKYDIGADFWTKKG